MFGSAGLGRNLSRSTGLALQDVRVGRIGPMPVNIDGARLPGFSGRLLRAETSLDPSGARPSRCSGRPGWTETSLTGLVLQDIRVGRIGPMLVKIDGARFPGFWGQLNRAETSPDQSGTRFFGCSGRPGWAETSLDRLGLFPWIFGSAGLGRNLCRSTGLVLQDCPVGRIGPKSVKIGGARLPGFSDRPGRAEICQDRRCSFSRITGLPDWDETSLDRSGSSSWIVGSAESGGNLSRSTGLVSVDFRIGRVAPKPL